MRKVPVVVLEGTVHVTHQTGLLVLLAWRAIDFINAFRGAVKGMYSLLGDVTSASAKLENQTSHDSTQILGFSCGVLKALFQSSEGRDGGACEGCWHILQLLESLKYLGKTGTRFEVVCSFLFKKIRRATSCLLFYPVWVKTFVQFLLLSLGLTPHERQLCISRCLSHLRENRWTEASNDVMMSELVWRSTHKLRHLWQTWLVDGVI